MQPCVSASKPWMHAGFQADDLGVALFLWASVMGDSICFGPVPLRGSLPQLIPYRLYPSPSRSELKPPFNQRCSKPYYLLDGMRANATAEASLLVSSIQSYVDKTINDFFVMLGNGEVPCSL